MRNKKSKIVNELVRLMKQINGTSPYLSNLYDNVKNRQVFLEDITDFPSVCIYSGEETREYLPGDVKWAFLTITIRVYVESEDPQGMLENVSGDIELVLDNNNDLIIDGNSLCSDIRILSITDDEGLLNPLGVSEMVLEIRYLL